MLTGSVILPVCMQSIPSWSELPRVGTATARPTCRGHWTPTGRTRRSAGWPGTRRGDEPHDDFRPKRIGCMMAVWWFWRGGSESVRLAAVLSGPEVSEPKLPLKAEVLRSFNSSWPASQAARSESHHTGKGATDANATGGKGRIRIGDRRHPVLCLCQLGQDIP